MPYRKNTFFPGGYFHIYNRGVNRNQIFFGEEDYRYCLSLLKKYAETYYMTIIAYCLMPNHYHFILRQNSDKSISQFIGVVFNAYVQSLNKKYSRVGTLFEGRFKNTHIDNENYILQLCRYLHLNTLKGRIVDAPEEWPYSDYNDWIAKRSLIQFDSNIMSSYFKDPNDYRKYVMEYNTSDEERDIENYLLE
jgi:REP-associated tyrosine transposase